MFGKPNEASRSALDATEVAVGEHRLSVKPELKEAALRVSKCLVNLLLLLRCLAEQIMY
jgi:nuclear pore complex protein Nup188